MTGPDDIAALVGQGVAVMVAARDAELRAEMGRAWGPSPSDGGGCLTPCVEAAPDSGMAHNLESGRLRAVTEHVDRFVSCGVRVSTVVGAPLSRS